MIVHQVEYGPRVNGEVTEVSQGWYALCDDICTCTSDLFDTLPALLAEMESMGWQWDGHILLCDSCYADTYDEALRGVAVDREVDAIRAEGVA